MVLHPVTSQNNNVTVWKCCKLIISSMTLKLWIRVPNEEQWLDGSALCGRYRELFKFKLSPWYFNAHYAGLRIAHLQIDSALTIEEEPSGTRGPNTDNPSLLPLVSPQHWCAHNNNTRVRYHLRGAQEKSQLEYWIRDLVCQTAIVKRDSPAAWFIITVNKGNVSGIEYRWVTQ